MVNRRRALAGILAFGLVGFSLALIAGASPQAGAALPDVDPHKAVGSKTAPIAIEVFSDFQCPACKQLYSTTMKQVIENYVNTGKVYLIHRDFPLPMHAYSRVAARYGVAAAHLGKFEPVEKILFEKQETWEQNGDVDGTVAGVLTAADMAKVRALVKGGTLEPEINKDYGMGQTYQVNQTPTSIIHYKGQTYPVVGQQSYPIFRDFLDQLLSMK
jgi:protein-disulfide isomerase